MKLFISFGSLALCALAGCTVGPNYQRPAAPAPPAFKEQVPPPNLSGGTWTEAQPQDALHRGKWWEIYDDPKLNSLEENSRDFQSNPGGLRADDMRPRENRFALCARTLSRRLSAGAGASRTGQSQNKALYSSGSTTRYNDFSLLGQATWEPDLWGQRSAKRGISEVQCASERS